MSFYSVVNRVIKEAETKGYSSDQQLQLWVKLVRDAAIKQMMPEDKLQLLLDRTLRGKFTSALRGKIGVERLEPQLRQELNKRIYSSINLIKLNRQEAVEKTLLRLSGWITSGDDKADTKDIKKSLKQLPFVERRVIIDQSHKLTANINNIVAVGGGSIAVEWHSHFREPGYNYRPDHKERDSKIYAIRGNWAQQAGLMKSGNNGYYEDITGFSVEPFCRCYGTYLYSISDLPADMLTIKGSEALSKRVK